MNGETLARLVEAYWPVFAGAFGFVVWLVRLEGKGGFNERRIAHLEAQVENLDGVLAKELSEVKQSLARIEGILQGHREAGE